MKVLPTFYFSKTFQARLLVVFSVAIVLIVTACTVPPGSVSNSPLHIGSENSLIPGDNTSLIENRWRVIEITYHNVAVEFEAIQPIYLTFTDDGQVIKNTTDCNTDGYYIIASSEHEYHLEGGSATAVDCGEIGNAQYERVNEAIAATTMYEMQGSQLFLTGDEVHVTLEIDNNH